MSLRKLLSVPAGRLNLINSLAACIITRIRLVKMIYLPGSCESCAQCPAMHGSLDERIHTRMAALVQFMEAGVALRHQVTQLLELLVFHYAAFLVYATEREHSACLCERKSTDAANCDKFCRRPWKRTTRFSTRRGRNVCQSKISWSG